MPFPFTRNAIRMVLLPAAFIAFDTVENPVVRDFGGVSEALFVLAMVDSVVGFDVDSIIIFYQANDDAAGDRARPTIHINEKLIL